MGYNLCRSLALENYQKIKKSHPNSEKMILQTFQLTPEEQEVPEPVPAQPIPPPVPVVIPAAIPQGAPLQ